MDHMSDGEIAEEFSEISSEEDDYFENLKKLSERKLELEIENSLASSTKSGGDIRLGQNASSVRRKFSEKENHFSNHRIPPKTKRLQSRARHNSSKEVKRNRSYRASSVFSHYSIPKSRKPDRWRSNKKTTRTQSQRRPQPEQDFSNNSINVEEGECLSEEPSSDEELLELRLNALKSKQEVKELIDDEPSAEVQPNATEEDNLRLLALKSTFIKKIPSILERKKKKKLESERPYSPSDDPLVLDNDSLNLGSPFNEVEMIEERELSDMDIVPSPNNNLVESDANDEELALRSILLCSISTKKVVEKKHFQLEGHSESSIEFNLKLAVQRIKQRQQSSKSGSKTISMILAEQQSKKTFTKNLEAQPEKPLNPVKSVVPSEEIELGIPLDVSVQANSFLRTMKKDLNQPIATDYSPDTQKSPQIDAETSFSTITDTKNIPLLTQSEKSKRSRLITSFDLVKQTVAPLVITANTGSDTEEDSRQPLKNTATKIVQKLDIKPTSKTPNEIDNFLKQVRIQQENARNKKNLIVTKLTSVKHLPLSSQIEYENLIKKMKTLEAKQKARVVKRKQQPVLTTNLPSPKKLHLEKPKENKQPDKIAESLRKIPQLNKEAQQSLMAKAENNYRKHSTILMEATSQSIKLLDETQENVKKQQQAALLISMLEKRLQSVKANLKVTNQQVKMNAYKVIQSQREIMKLNGNKERFGKICQQVGVMTSGKDYSLEDAESTELVKNFKKIAVKTEEIIQASTTDQIVKTHLKLVAERVRSFIVETPILEVDSVDTTRAKEAKSEQLSAINTHDHVTVEQKNIEGEDGDSEVSKMIREDYGRSENELLISVDQAPEFQKQTKLTLEGNFGKSTKRTSVIRNSTVQKKLMYESPLEFLRLPKNKTSSVNKITCPYHLEGTCNDEKCQMMHI